jgi:hypothetical protein
MEEIAKRRSFEQLVLKRPYFHVKPLDETQLQNWRSYLDFEEKEGNLHRIEKLYERCLIACVCEQLHVPTETPPRLTIHFILAVQLL